MKGNNIFIAIIMSALLVTGCAQIPQAAIDVNKQVSTGITTLGDNGQEMINAWEETAYKMLDERWDKIYESAEKKFRTKKSIPTARLTKSQLKMVAEIAVLARDDIRTIIHSEANNMRATISSNTKTTLDANESITNLLVSANAVGIAHKTAIKQVSSLIPIPPAISGFIDSALETTGG